MSPEEKYRATLIAFAACICASESDAGRARSAELASRFSIILGISLEALHSVTHEAEAMLAEVQKRWHEKHPEASN